MQRRDALKTMSVGAVALATGSLPTLGQSSPNKTERIVIDAYREWRIEHLGNNHMWLWMPHEGKLQILRDNPNGGTRKPMGIYFTSRSRGTGIWTEMESPEHRISIYEHSVAQPRCEDICFNGSKLELTAKVPGVLFEKETNLNWTISKNGKEIGRLFLGGLIKLKKHPSFHAENENYFVRFRPRWHWSRLHENRMVYAIPKEWIRSGPNYITECCRINLGTNHAKA